MVSVEIEPTQIVESQLANEIIPPISPEEPPEVIDQLFQDILSARIARQALISRRGSQSWAIVGDNVKESVQQTLEESEPLKGWVILPNRISNMSIPTAKSSIEQGLTSFERLKQAMIDSKLSDYVDLFPEARDEIIQVLGSSAVNTLRLFKPQPDTHLLAAFATSAQNEMNPVIIRLEQEAEARKAEEALKQVRTQEEEMLTANTRLVMHVVRKMLARQIFSSNLDFEDAIAEGRVGLLQAVRRYNAEEGPFSSFAVPRIRGAILDAIRQASPLTNGAQRNNLRIRGVEEQFEAKNGRTPTIEELSQATGFSLRTIEDTKRVMSMKTLAIERGSAINPYDAREIQIPEADPAFLPEETLIQKEEANEGLQRAEALRLMLDELPPRIQRIMHQSYIEELTLAEIGEEMNISASRVSQLRADGDRQLASIAAGLGPNVDFSLVMRKPSLTLVEFLSSIGVSYASYSNHELGKGIKFKRSKLKKGAGRGEIVVNPIQQELIKNRLENRNRDRVKERQRRNGLDPEDPLFDYKSALSQLTPRGPVLVELEPGEIYEQIHSTVLSSALQMGKEVAITKTPQGGMLVELISKRSHYIQGTDGEKPRTIEEETDSDSVEVQAPELMVPEKAAIIGKKKNTPKRKRQIIPQGWMKLSTFLSESGITPHAYYYHGLSSNLGIPEKQGRRGILLNPEQQRIITERYVTRNTKRGPKPKENVRY